MSNKLVRKKKNKPKYGWMQDEIDALARKDARDRQLAGYGVTMANHALEIGFWVYMISLDLERNVLTG